MSRPRTGGPGTTIETHHTRHHRWCAAVKQTVRRVMTLDSGRQAQPCSVCVARNETETGANPAAQLQSEICNIRGA